MKFHGNAFTEAGTPDIIACVDGHMIMIESKLPGNSSTAIQLVRADQWSRAGARVAEVHSLAEAKEFVREACQVNYV